MPGQSDAAVIWIDRHSADGDGIEGLPLFQNPQIPHNVIVLFDEQVVGMAVLAVTVRISALLFYHKYIGTQL